MSKKNIFDNFRYYNSYKLLDEVGKTNERNRNYIDTFISNINGSFKCNGLPKEITKFEIIKKAILCGGCVISKDGDVFKTWFGSPADKIRQDGTWNKVVGNSYNNEIFNGIDGVNCVVIYFNSNHVPEYDLFRYSDILSEIDLSLDFNVLYSRYAPLVLCDNENEKISIETALKNIKIGKPLTILSKGIMKKFMSGNSGNDNATNEKILNVTDVRNADKIQYLVEYHDNVNRWIHTKYGNALSCSPKHAQVNNGEIDGATNTSYLYISTILDELKKGFERVNELFSVNWTIDFNDLMLNSFDNSDDSEGGDDNEDNPT